MQRPIFIQSPTPIDTRIPGINEEKILFAMAPVERNQFFRSKEPSTIGSTECLWADPLSFSSEQEWRTLLAEIRPTVCVSCWRTPKVPYDLVASGLVPLRYICNTSGSVRHVVPREFIANGGWVTNWGSSVGYAVAEHALMLILAALRNLSQWTLALNGNIGGRWGNGMKMGTHLLRGRRVGLHGFGNIARELVRLLQPFGVVCSAYSEGVPADFMRRHGVEPCASLEALFSSNDVLAECEALTPQNRGIINEAVLKLIPEGGVFVNVARGALVDQEALERVSRERCIRVASDVFLEEPVPEDSPLRQNLNVLISPHVGGPTVDCYPRCGEFALNNISRYLDGKPLEGMITMDIFDRST
ncbi:MAG: hydroxyacid dehydrogenase [Chthoniobacteraceae bacterium]